MKNIILFFIAIMCINITKGQEPTLEDTKEWITEELNQYVDFRSKDDLSSPLGTTVFYYENFASIYFLEDSLVVKTVTKLNIYNGKNFYQNNFNYGRISIKDIKKVKFTMNDDKKYYLNIETYSTPNNQNPINNSSRLTNIEYFNTGSYDNDPKFYTQYSASFMLRIGLDPKIIENNIQARLTKAFIHLVNSSGGNYYISPF